MKLRITSAILIALGSLNAACAHATTHNSEGLTPLHIAAGYGDLARVKSLVSSQADLFSVDSKMGVSILHKAVYSGNAEVVTYLLSQGALVNLSSPSNGNTPLHDALYFKPGSDTRVIEAILRFKPQTSIRNRAGLTPKESAKLLKDEASLRLIEAYEATLYTSAGRALMKAVKENNVEQVRALINSSGQPLDEADEQGFTPLTWAAREGFAEITEMLLQKGANPNRLDQWMQANAGHKASFWGRAETIRLLIQYGLDVNARGGYNGYTALHDAVARGHVQVVKILIAAGARRDIRGHDGKSALDIARSSGNAEILEMLE